MTRLFAHPEARVALCLLAVLGACEAGIRLSGSRLSKDVRHLEQFEEIAARISAPPRPGETRVLFLGNSLTRYGVDVDEFTRALTEAGQRRVRVERLMPDNTALADWYYAYRSFFADCGRAPDVLVIGFAGGHLDDAPSRHPERLARYYCRLKQWPELCRRDLLSMDSRTGFMLAGLSSLWCNRDRIESRVLDLVISGYQAGIQDLNRRLTRNLRRTPTAPTFDRLRQLLTAARRDGVEVILAAMPIPDSYDLPPELWRIAEEFGVRLIDCRRVPGITTEMFPDGLHMNAPAARLYTRFLARAWSSSRRMVEEANRSLVSAAVTGGDGDAAAWPSPVPPRFRGRLNGGESGRTR